ncbi:MAG: DUF6044 family protein [Lachnospiraceae bacterium]|nr:DUF6044 family protein [Lachnospiraceae bacterium]
MKADKKNGGVFLILIFFVCSLLYILVKRDNLYLQIHDYLDSGIAHYKMIKDSHLFWTFSSSVPYLGGLDRNYFFSELKVFSWIYMIFPCFPAIIIGWYCKISIAIAGFYYLGKIIFGNDENGSVYLIAGLIYGITPTQPINSFGFASLPFLLAVMILLKRKFEVKYLVFMFFYPLFSDFVFFGLFICGFTLVFFFIDWINEKKPGWRFIGAIIALSAGFIITEWRLFYTFLVADGETIRDSFVSNDISVLQCLKDFVWVFLFGQYHSASLHLFPVLPVCLIYFFILNIGYVKKKKAGYIFKDPFNPVMLLQVFNCAIYAINETHWFKTLIATIIPPLKGFSFARTLWLCPFLWYLAFMMVLCRVKWKSKTVKYSICLMSFVFVCLFPSKYNHISTNVFSLVGDVLGNEIVEQVFHKKNDKLTYGEFYSEKLFDRIKEDIDYNGEWAIAYGMHPAVLEYNDISTLDGYVSFYSADYKSTFREMIEPELEKDEKNREYFDNWGGRAYVFSKDVGYDAVRDLQINEAALLINPEVFSKMGGKYVFSRVRVSNHENLGMEEIGMYSDDSSPYSIWVYAR